MGTCKPIYGLKLDSRSKSIIKKISNSPKMELLLKSAVLAGTLNSIFTKGDALSTPVNIGLTDWILFIKALKSTGAIREGINRRNIEFALSVYGMDRSSNGQKLYRFWEGVENGCRP